MNKKHIKKCGCNKEIEVVELSDNNLSNNSPRGEKTVPCKCGCSQGLGVVEVSQNNLADNSHEVEKTTACKCGSHHDFGVKKISQNDEAKTTDEGEKSTACKCGCGQGLGVVEVSQNNQADNGHEVDKTTACKCGSNQDFNVNKILQNDEAKTIDEGEKSTACKCGCSQGLGVVEVSQNNQADNSHEVEKTTACKCGSHLDFGVKKISQNDEAKTIDEGKKSTSCKCGCSQGLGVVEVSHNNQADNGHEVDKTTACKCGSNQDFNVNKILQNDEAKTIDEGEKSTACKCGCSQGLGVVEVSQNSQADNSHEVEKTTACKCGCGQGLEVVEVPQNITHNDKENNKNNTCSCQKSCGCDNKINAQKSSFFARHKAVSIGLIICAVLVVALIITGAIGGWSAVKNIGSFVSNQILGMKWLNSLIGMALSGLFGSQFVSGRWGGALQFFIYDIIKIFVLLSLLIYTISYIQSYFPPERTKRILGKHKGMGANILGALLGTVTPFCSCSSIPIFMGFTRAGLSSGITFSFLISSPLVDLGAFVLLASIFGFPIAITYVIVGLILAVIGGTIIEKTGVGNHIQDYILQGEASQFELVEVTKKQRLEYAKKQTLATIKKVWLYVLIGVGIGAVIHNFIPTEWIQAVLGQDKWYSVIVASIVGVPMYADIFGTIPVAEALFMKGVGVGTILAFMMSVTALSLPSMIMLSKAVKPKLLASFIAIVVIGIVIIGYVFNALGFLFV